MCVISLQFSRKYFLLQEKLSDICDKICTLVFMSGIIYSYHISMNLEFSGQIVGKYTEIRNFTKIRPVETRLFRADGRTDGRTDSHEGANSRFS